MNGPQIHPDQGPPLSVPLIFFFTAPLSLAAAGVLLLTRGPGLLLSGDAPATLLLTHLGTLGFLAMVMFGAFLQMAPVIAAAPVPRVRLAHAVHGALAIGLLVFALGALGVVPLPRGYGIGFAWIAFAVVLFLVLTGIALGRTRARGEVVTGMRLVLASLLVAALVGTWMQLAYGGHVTVPRRDLWIQTHASVAMLGWVGGLIGVVAWEVLPMFYLAAPLPRWKRQLWLIGTYAGVAWPVAVLAVTAVSPELLGTRWVAAAGTLPAVAAVWVIQPVWMLRALRARRRRRADESLRYWWIALGVSPVVALAAVSAAIVPDARAKFLFVWLAVWGWAGTTVFGMLVRIVPFLVWLHRFSGRVGREPVPSMKALLPDPWIRWLLRAHLITLCLGCVAVSTRGEVACRALGGGIVVTALVVTLAMGRAVWRGSRRCYAGGEGSGAKEIAGVGGA